MQNFGNYNVNPNTPIYVGGGKKKVKKQSEDKSLGEKVAIGVASTAGAIAAILIGYGIINKFTGNTTKITKDAKEAATAVLPKAKDAGKKLLPPNKSGDQNVRTILKNLNKIKDGSLTYDQAIKMKQSLQVLCKKGSVSDVKLNGIDLAPFFNHLLLYLSDITKNGKDNFRCNTTNTESLYSEGANFWTRIKKIDNINKYLGNFQLTDITVDSGNKKLSLAKNGTTKKISNLKFQKYDNTSNLIELCNGLYIVEGSINDASKLYIKNKEGKFAEITLENLKEGLNPVVTIDHSIDNLNDIKELDNAKVVNGQKDGITELYLTGLKKESDENIYSIKVSTLVADSKLLTKLIQLKNITPDIFAEVIKTADASILYQLMNDANLKAKLVEKNGLTDVGKKIVGAAIRGTDGNINSGKIAEMLNGITDLTEGSVGAAVVDHLIGRKDVTAEMLYQVMNNGDLKAKFIRQDGDDKGKLTEAGKKIVDAAIKGGNEQEKATSMVTMLKELDLKEGVGAAVVDHLMAHKDVTAEILNQVMENEGLKAKLVEQSGNNKDKLTAAGEKIMKKAIDKHISLSALKVLAQTLRIKNFTHTISDTEITLEIDESSQLWITNSAQYVYNYIKACGANGAEVADGDRLLFRSILKEKAYNTYFDENGKFKASASFEKDDFDPKYTTKHTYKDFESVKYLTQEVIPKWATCQDQLALNLSAPTTLGQVLVSQDIQDKLTTGNPPKLTAAGEAIVEAAIVHDTTGLEQNAKDKKQQENIVELLSNFGSFDENTVGAAVINHLMDHKDVTVEMLGQALNDSELKAKFFNEPTSEGTTTYSLTPAGQYMIKQAAKKYNNNPFTQFAKSFDLENYIECIYNTLGSIQDDDTTKCQAYYLIRNLIQTDSTKDTLKTKLHSIINSNSNNYFDFRDLSYDEFTTNGQISKDGILALTLFANSKSSDFIDTVKEDTTLRSGWGSGTSTIKINGINFIYNIDGPNHTVSYRKK